MTTDVKAARRAANLFLVATQRAQGELGYPTTKTVLAHAVGETPQAFGDVLAGRQGSIERVAGWIEQWNAVRPRFPLVLVFANTVPFVMAFKFDHSFDSPPPGHFDLYRWEPDGWHIYVQDTFKQVGAHMVLPFILGALA